MANLSKKDLQQLVDSVSLQLTEVLAKAEEIPNQELAKATPGNETPSEKVPTGSSTTEETPGEAPNEDSSSASPDASSAPAEGASDGTPPVDGAAPAEAPADGAAPDPAQDETGSVESLQAEYSALPLEELKMHLLACKAALMAQMVQGGGEGAESAAPDADAAEGTPPALEGAAPADGAVPPAPEGEPPMQKTETDPAVLERLTSLEKSLKEKDEIINGFGAVASNLERILTKRKSAHSIAVLGKPGTEMAKSEDGIDVSSLKTEQVIEKLNEITANGKLSKSDRDAVISYVASSVKDITKIAHLLTKKN
jgi:hypothetical protein